MSFVSETKESKSKFTGTTAAAPVSTWASSPIAGRGRGSMDRLDGGPSQHPSTAVRAPPVAAAAGVASPVGPRPARGAVAASRPGPPPRSIPDNTSRSTSRARTPAGASSPCGRRTSCRRQLLRHSVRSGPYHLVNQSRRSIQSARSGRVAGGGVPTGCWRGAGRSSPARDGSIASIWSACLFKRNRPAMSDCKPA